MEKKVFRGIDTLFYNSQCVFIEYHDVISMPWFTMLYYMRNSEYMNTIFNMDSLRDYSLTGLLEWYLNRKHRNVFEDILTREGKSINYDNAVNILNQCMELTDDFYKIDTNLKFMSVLRLLLAEQGLVKKFYIYSEKEEAGIKTVLDYYFKDYGTKIQYITGSFGDVLKLMPKDSTYVFSDITKVQALIDNGRLNYSALLITNGLRYNYELENMKKIKVNITELSKSYVFKGDFFDNFDMTNALASGTIPSVLSNLSKGEKNEDDTI